MPTIIEGVYRDGKIELSETPSALCEGTRVVVTFIPPGSIDLREHGIDEAQAAELRARLACFAEDWESPEMDIYDNYDKEKVKLANLLSKMSHVFEHKVFTQKTDSHTPAG